jgi:hypothetical protein
VGTLVTECLTLDYPGSLSGVHMRGVPCTRLFVPPINPSAAEQEYLTSSIQYLTQRAAYVPSKPAHWLLDKFRTWSNSGGNLESGFS